MELWVSLAFNPTKNKICYNMWHHTTDDKRVKVVWFDKHLHQVCSLLTFMTCFMVIKVHKIKPQKTLRQETHCWFHLSVMAFSHSHTHTHTHL